MIQLLILPRNWINYTIIIATNIFSSAVRALKVNSSIKQVILLKQPQSSHHEKNWLSLRSSLAQLFNDTIHNLWLESPFKDPIILGNDSFDVKEVTNTVISLTKGVFKTPLRGNERFPWQTVQSRRSRPHVQHLKRNTRNEFSLPIHNRFTHQGN